MRVAFYTRLSPNPDKDDTVNQETDLIEFAKRHGWEVVAFYKDVHVSGNVKGSVRPEFQRMMKDASQRKFDLLLFWSLDRLSREGAFETLQYLNQLNSYGVDYKSYTEQYLDSCGIFKDAVISIMAVVAKQERVRLIERTRAGVATARAKGVKFGRPRTVLDRVKIVERRNRGESIKEIARSYQTSHDTVYRLLKREEAHG